MMMMVIAADPRIERIFIEEDFIGHTLRGCRTEYPRSQLARPNSGIDGNPNRVRCAVDNSKPMNGAACFRPTRAGTCPEVSCMNRPDPRD
ncbi:MAG: hypothetical protein WAR01_07020 [Dokdonella sp.]|uniref:hypothetical protein n=1 Tax=Dokdonella sp. TaxID=2291710 RepID=UPI0031C64002|nr:hypothetical protein [Xanthomonadales bacterium]